MFKYATKPDVKTQQVLGHRVLLKKADLASPKFEVDELDVAKLETISTDLSKLSNAVEKYFVKKAICDELV